MERPKSNEYPPYYHQYIDLIKDEDILTVLKNQKHEMRDLLINFEEESALFRYAPDKWSVKEVIGHLIDVERIFAYRALRFARKDKTPLPGFDQDNYIKYANFNSRSLINIAAEFRAVKESTVSMFESFKDEIYSYEGTASGFKFTVRAIAYIIAGHEVHHRHIIREKYMANSR